MSKSGSYRFIDNPNNLCLRIQIRKSPSHKVFANDSFDETESDSSSDSYEEHIIKWQQKIFSQKEIDWFKMNRDYETLLEKKYHIEINKNKLNTKSDKKSMFKIFTITDSDISLERWSQFYDKKVIGLKSNERFMHVLLDTKEEPNGLLICKLSMQTSRKILNVTPDFNSLTQTYNLKNIDLTVHGTCDVDYVIDIEPNRLTSEELENRNLLIEKLGFALSAGRPKLSLTQMPISMEPVLNDTIMQINGEIDFADNFECWNLCVCFYIEANKNWTFINNLNDSFFYGMTQKCFINDYESAFFSTPFETSIKYSNENIFMDKWPILYLKVLSFDYWNRLIFESYGSVELPKRIGRYSLSINTWKPYANNSIDKLKQFFTGCSPIFEKSLYINSSLTSNKCLNNYGLQCESSGSVHLNLDVIIQTESSEVIKQSKEKRKSFSFSSMQQNLSSVVSAFQRAKKRMEFIRNEINKSNIS